MATDIATERHTATGEPVVVVQEERRETLPESLAGTAYVFVLGLFLMTFLFQNYAIPSGSMEPTLLIGDHVVVDRSTIAPQNYPMPIMHYRNVRLGDIIVFVKPVQNEPDMVLVKRAVGLPGDRIHLQHGILYRNGQRINEPQISMPSDNGDPQAAYDPYRDDFPLNQPHGTTESWAVDLPNHVQNGELVVPDHVIFAMGDNRIGSLDSRFWGFVPRENILGRPMFVYWSFKTPADEMDKTGASASIGWMVHVLTHFVSDTRWSRTGHIIR